MSVDWNVENKNKLINYIDSDMSKKEIAEVFKCSESSIYAMTRKLAMTKIECKDLLNKLNINSKKDRTKIQIPNRPWTELDDKQLIDLRSKNMFYKDISSIMNRSIQSLRDRAKHLNISKQLRGWTKEEEMRLEQVYRQTSNICIVAEKMGRSEESIKQRLILLGLYINKRKAWNKVDVESLKFLYTTQNRSIEDIANILGKSQTLVESKLKALKLIKSQKNTCIRCGENAEIIKGGLYKGYCQACVEDLKAKQIAFNSYSQREDNSKKVIQLYIKKHFDELKFCKKCNSTKNPYSDYYYSVQNKDGWECVWSECKECNKSRRKRKKIENIKNKGY